MSRRIGERISTSCSAARFRERSWSVYIIRVSKQSMYLWWNAESVLTRVRTRAWPFGIGLETGWSAWNAERRPRRPWSWIRSIQRVKGLDTIEQTLRSSQGLVIVHHSSNAFVKCMAPCSLRARHPPMIPNPLASTSVGSSRVLHIFLSIGFGLWFCYIHYTYCMDSMRSSHLSLVERWVVVAAVLFNVDCLKDGGLLQFPACYYHVFLIFIPYCFVFVFRMADGPLHVIIMWCFWLFESVAFLVWFECQAIYSMLIYIQYAAFMYLDYEDILFDMTSLPLLTVEARW